VKCRAFVSTSAACLADQVETWMKENEVTTRHFAVAATKDGISALVIYTDGRPPTYGDIAELMDQWQRDALAGVRKTP
jgi:hypothetical protein